jgi:RNA:NAD 2'-phosphotransferase (TPT1/KptA family)
MITIENLNKFMTAFLSKYDDDLVTVFMSPENQTELAQLFAKKKRDPALPKGKKSAYMFFCQEKRSELKEDGVTGKEATKKMAEMWKVVNKDVYNALAAKDKQRWEEEMEKYTPSEGFTIPEKKTKTEKTPKKTKRDPALPKGKKSAYMFFCQEKRSELKEDGVTGKEATKKMAEMWKVVNKDTYKALAAKDKQRWEEDMKKYTPSEGFTIPEKKTKTEKTPKKTKRDPALPKGKKNSYMFFCQEKRPELKEDGVTGKEATKKISKMWNKLKKKYTYNVLAAKDKQRWKEEMEKYVPSEGYEKNGILIEEYEEKVSRNVPVSARKDDESEDEDESDDDLLF